MPEILKPEKNKSMQELRNLAITQVFWNEWATIGFNLSDGQFCKAGTLDFNKSYTVDPIKKITLIECVIRKNEYRIIQINFYSGS